MIILSKNTSSPFDLDFYFLAIATLSLVAAVLLPYFHRRYDEKRTKRSFKLFLKKQLGNILLFLINNEIQYVDPSKEGIKPINLKFDQFKNRLLKDLDILEDTKDERFVFLTVQNIQHFYLSISNLRESINRIDFKNLLNLTLEHGKRLKKNELSEVYEAIVTVEGFISVSIHNDKFEDLKSVKRIRKNEIWVGFSVNRDELSEAIYTKDQKIIITNRFALIEVFGMYEKLYDTVLNYLEY